jgi:tetratricopeptide (TPR) repeat protein
MPFTPSHKRRFKANKVFTDRERPVTLFLRAFDPPPAPDAYRALVFYGVGGEGKTALARHLLGLLEREYAGRAGWAAVNFEDAALRRPAEALLSIRLQLRRTAGLSFPAFDTAFAHWFGKTYPGADIRQRHPELFRQASEEVGDALGYGFDVLKEMSKVLEDALGEVPGLGLVWKYGNRFHARFREWWERRGREVLRGIEGLQPDQLQDRLPAFLGADIADAIAAMPRRQPLAIIGDTMEAFHRGEAQKGGGFNFRNDRWLRDLVKETPGILFVLLGRDRLRWAEVEPEWAEVLDQHRLGALSPEDAERYLLGVPVEEAEIRARMAEGAKGLPFYLDLQVDLYESLRNQGRAPEPAQFGGSEPEILNRFLDHLGGTAARALAVLAHCRRFDEALWLHLGQEFMGGLPPFAFGELREFSFVEELEGGWLGLHALMREALCARTAEGEPVLHERVHRCLFAWYDHRCRPADVRSVTPAHGLALEDATFHRAIFERETFGDWARERGVPFAEAARNGIVGKLWETALEIEEATLPQDDPKIARTLSNLGAILIRKGDLEGALSLQERALASLKGALGPDHPEFARALANLGVIYNRKGDTEAALVRLEQALRLKKRTLGSDHPEVGRTLSNLANVFRGKGDLNAALVHQKQACEMLECALGPDHPDVASSLNSLGIILWLKGDLNTALVRLERALAIMERTFGPDHPDLAVTLTNLGSVLRAIGDPETAVARYERALAIQERALGPDHPDVAAALMGLGTVLYDRGDLEAASARYERALVIKERAFGPDHPEVAITLGSLGNVLQENGELDAALAHQGRALAIQERALGPDHPNTGGTLTNLGIVLWRKGDLGAALACQERALAIQERALGPDHPDVARSLLNLSIVLADKGELDAARASQERALAINERTLGPDHPGVAMALFNLSMAEEKLGAIAAGREHRVRALAIFRSRLGEQHPHTETVRRSLEAMDADAGIPDVTATARDSLGPSGTATAPDHP